MAWFPWRQVDISSPLTVSEAREALLGNVPQVFGGQVGAASFQVTRAPLVITGEFAGSAHTRIRVTLRLTFRAYGMLVFGVLGFPLLLGRGLMPEQRAGWVFLGLAGFAFALTGVSPVWRFQRKARWSEHALRAIFGAGP
ncbi:MAG: hypothetical protein ABI548_15500 [Polyangiaceae bacterium]